MLLGNKGGEDANVEWDESLSEPTGFNPHELGAPPASIDWRGRGAVTSVKN